MYVYTNSSTVYPTKQNSLFIETRLRHSTQMVLMFLLRASNPVLRVIPKSAKPYRVTVNSERKWRPNPAHALHSRSCCTSCTGCSLPRSAESQGTSAAGRRRHRRRCASTRSMPTTRSTSERGPHPTRAARQGETSLHE